MRPVLHSDMIAAARAVLAVPEEARPDFCLQIMREAETADKFVRRLGKLHPLWGNGTLMGAARAHGMAPEETFGDLAYCRAFQTVLCGVMAREER